MVPGFADRPPGWVEAKRRAATADRSTPDRACPAAHRAARPRRSPPPASREAETPEPAPPDSHGSCPRSPRSKDRAGTPGPDEVASPVAAPPPRPRAHPAERPLDGAEVAKLGLDFDHEDQAGDRMPGEDENSAPRSVAADLHLPCDVPAGALKPPGDVDRAPRVDDVTLPCVPRNGARTSSRSVAPIADSNRSMVSIDTSERQPRSTELIHACDTPARAASVRCVQPRGVRTSLTACPSRSEHSGIQHVAAHLRVSWPPL